jgi:Holliday junction resolvasome RuvABC endonuclease subunit
MKIIGIDPGSSGCIAVIDEHGKPGERLRLKDKSEHEISEFVADVMHEAQDSKELIFAMVEQVSSSPQMGVCSAFTFGESFGALKMVLAALHVPFTTVTPQKWQGELGVKRANKDIKQSEHKRNLKAAAKKLWPAEKILKDDADAMLIAEYARRMHKQGKL